MILMTLHRTRSLGNYKRVDYKSCPLLLIIIILHFFVNFFFFEEYGLVLHRRVNNHNSHLVLISY